jgi:hypothetical protein
LQRRIRNRICIWLIFGGLLNLLVYTVIYAELGGDAVNGEVVDADTGGQQRTYYIRGHFIRGLEGRQRSVSKGVWIYSFIHSISLWPTQACMIIATLILARPHIIATMRESTWIRGPTFITIVVTLTVVLYAVITAWFAMQFIRDLSQTGT